MTVNVIHCVCIFLQRFSKVCFLQGQSSQYLCLAQARNVTFRELSATEEWIPISFAHCTKISRHSEDGIVRMHQHEKPFLLAVRWTCRSTRSIQIISEQYPLQLPD